MFPTLPLSGQIQYCFLEGCDLALRFSCMFLPVSTCLIRVHCQHEVDPYSSQPSLSPVIISVNVTVTEASLNR